MIFFLVAAPLRWTRISVVVRGIVVSAFFPFVFVVSSEKFVPPRRWLVAGQLVNGSVANPESSHSLVLVDDDVDDDDGSRERPRMWTVSSTVSSKMGLVIVVGMVVGHGIRQKLPFASS